MSLDAVTMGAAVAAAKAQGKRIFGAKWQAATAYAAGDTVVHRGVTYQAKVAFTSGATFNAANWNTLADAPAVADTIGAGLTSARSVTDRLSAMVANRYKPNSAYFPLSPQTDALTSRPNLVNSLAPWVVDELIVLTGMWVDVTTAGSAGATFRPTIYADDGHGYPGQIVADLGTVPADAVGRPSVTCNLTLEPGVYWIGGAVQGATTTAPVISSTTSSWTPPIPVKVGTTTPPASRQAATGFNMTAPASGPAALAWSSTLLLAGNAPRVGIFTGAAPKLPDSPLRWRPKPSGFFPMSVGADGYCYGAFLAVGRSQVARTNDGGETFELGYDFAGQMVAGQNVIWVGALWNGTQYLYNVVTSTSTSVAGGGTGRIYNARNFAGTGNGNYVNRRTTKAINDLAISRVVRYSNGKDMQVIGEYSVATPSIALDLWLTTDAGDSWTSIRQTTPTDTAENAHWHAIAIDSTTFRIWASQGDRQNSWFGYTDNLGGAWTAVPLPTTDPLYDGVSVYVQPTTLTCFSGSALFGGPDRSAFAVGLWRHDLTTGLPKPAYKLDTLVPTTSADVFPRGPHVQTGDVAIIAFPDKTLDSIPWVWFVGTGDRGHSWHNLGRIRLPAKDTGARPIIGPDTGGFVYWKSVGGPSPYGDNLMVAPMPVFAAA